jgi:hypothetical protein
VLVDRRFVATENYYTSLEQQGERAHQPAAPVAYDWARQNYRDFVAFTSADDVLPVLVSQATIAVQENLETPEYRVVMGTNTPGLGMTLTVLADTWRAMGDILHEVADESGAVFVDGYRAVPHDLVHLSDHVHLTDRGADALAREIASVLLRDPRFRERAERVRSAG